MKFLLMFLLVFLLIACDTDNPTTIEEGCKVKEDCLNNQVCIDSECLTIICQASKQTCIDKSSYNQCNSDGTAERVVSCNLGQECLDGNCIDKDCQNGEFECTQDNKGYKVCENNSWKSISCTENKICDLTLKDCKESIVTVCTPNEVKCIDGPKEQRCSSDGTKWLDATECTGDNPSCVLNTGCVGGSCTPNEIVCVSDENFKRCNSSGDGWNTELESCNAGMVCQVNQCIIQQSCTPGEIKCHTNKNYKICNEEGNDYGDIIECPNSESGVQKECLNGECVDECEVAALKHSYIGCEYYAVDTDNGEGEFRNNSTTPLYFAIILSNPSDNEATVTIKDNNSSINITRTVASNAIEIVNLETLTSTGTTTINGALYHLWHDDHQIIGTAKGSNYSYHVKSNIPIVAYQFSPLGGSKNYSNDASMLIPITAYSKEYIVNSWEHWDSNNPLSTDGSSQTMTIVAKEDNTSVTIDFKAETKSGTGIAVQAAGSSTTKILSKGETIQFATKSGDLSGTRILADKSIGVFSGHSCTNIPSDKTACDHLEEQLFPLNTWGNHYVIVKTKKRGTEKDYYKIVTSEANTTIYFNPAITIRVNGRDVTLSRTTITDAQTVTPFSTDQSFEMTSDKPISVAQFMASQNAGANTGDPAFILQVPVEQYRESYLFLTPNTYAHDFVTIVAPSNNGTVAEVTLDNSIIPSSSFIQVGEYYYFIKDLSDGSHTITSSLPVGISVYGYDEYVSYGYPGGLNLINIKGE